MPRQFTSDLTLDTLKKEAKRWLKALRAGDPDARKRLATAVPAARDLPALRDVQLALAREFGLPGWMALKQTLRERAVPTSAGVPLPPGIVSRFLDNACPDHHVRGGADHVRAQGTAMRLLHRYPAIAHDSFYTAVVCGDLEAVQRSLASNPDWATRPDAEPDALRTDVGGELDLVKRDWGPKGWQPLSYLCFTRLPLTSVTDNAVAIARTLMDHGADANVSFNAGASSYTPLVGVIGEGEEGRPPHQQRDALVALLLERGADPYDSQVTYNIHFNGKVLWFLTTIYEHCVRTGRADDWKDPEWRMMNQGGYGSGARWYLDIAVDHNDLELARWCLEHGANANASAGAGRRGRQYTLYEGAVHRGHSELAELLVQYGAIRSTPKLPPIQRLVAACVRGDMQTIRDEITKHPEFLQQAAPLFAATERNRRDAAELLLDLGTSPNIESPQGERAMHIASYNDSIDVAELLIARGAEIDPIGRQYDNTPLGGAMHCQSARMVALLAGVSRNAWEIGYVGNVDRLRQLLAEKPERARATGDGETLLMWLPPDDESKAIEIAKLLLEHGADPTVRDANGMTAADRAERNAMFEVAALLRQRE